MFGLLKKLTKDQSSTDLTAEVASVKQQLADALAAVEQATARFVDTGDDSDAQAVLEAKKNVPIVELHLIRAERMLQAANERELEQRRKAAEEERERARQAHAAALDEDDRLEDEEARLLLQVVNIRAQRWKARTEARDIARKFVPHSHPDASSFLFLEVTRPTCDRVRKILEASAEGDPRFRLIHSLGLSDDHYNVHNPADVEWSKLQPLKVTPCPKRPRPKLRDLPPVAPRSMAPEQPPAPNGGYLRMVGTEREAG